jgi:hypothetical protein
MLITRLAGPGPAIVTLPAQLGIRKARRPRRAGRSHQARRGAPSRELRSFLLPLGASP